MTRITITFALLLVVVFCGTSLADQCPTVTAQSSITTKKNMGLWYVVSRSPSASISIVRCDNVTYTLNRDGTVSALELGLDAHDHPVTVTAVSTIINPANPGVLQVDFGNCMKGIYNIIAVEPKQYAFIYTCSVPPDTNTKTELGFILLRGKSLKPNILEKAKKVFAGVGVDVTQFIAIPQDCC